jgi:hypothetical protein
VTRRRVVGVIVAMPACAGIAGGTLLAISNASSGSRLAKVQAVRNQGGSNLGLQTNPDLAVREAIAKERALSATPGVAVAPSSTPSTVSPSVANVKPKGDHCDRAKGDHLGEKEKSAVVGRGKGVRGRGLHSGDIGDRQSGEDPDSGDS